MFSRPICIFVDLLRAVEKSEPDSLVHRLASKARPCLSLSVNLTLLRSHVQVKTFSRSVFFLCEL